MSTEQTDLAAAVAELRRLEAAATPLPWSVQMEADSYEDGARVEKWPNAIVPAIGYAEFEQPQEVNAELIVALRNAGPMLLRCAEIILEIEQKESRDGR